MKVLLIRPPYDLKSISPNFPIGLAAGLWSSFASIRRKRLKLPKVATFLRLAKQFGMRTQAFFIVGFPEETLAEINQTIRETGIEPATSSLGN